jgi:hypothetical protein
VELKIIAHQVRMDTKAVERVHDQRQIRIVASATGKRALLKGRERRRQALSHMLRGARGPELAALASVTHLLERALAEKEDR